MRRLYTPTHRSANVIKDDANAKSVAPEQAWLDAVKQKLGFDLDASYWNLLAQNSTRWAAELSQGIVLGEIKKQTDAWNTEYHAKTSSVLLAGDGIPNFQAKQPSSIKEKLFRNYQLNNTSLEEAFSPKPPHLPILNDLVRTRITCKFLDGVEFIADKIEAFVEQQGMKVERVRQGKIDGYFAQHLIIEQPVLFWVSGVDTRVLLRMEIQIASEMGTKMWEVSHSLYERTRRTGTGAEDWQWKPSDPRFICNQLGHMIHLVDGLLIQLRDSNKNQ